MPVAAVWDTEPLPNNEMGAPPAHLCRGGRLNPEGIPYLYLASDSNTAIAEVRPWRQARVTVATVRLIGGCRVVDFRRDASPALGAVQWTGTMMSRPVHEDDTLRYVATQLIAESLKAVGYNGVLYPSALNPSGFNLALFDPSHASVVTTELREVISVKYESGALSSGEDLLDLDQTDL